MADPTSEAQGDDGSSRLRNFGVVAHIDAGKTTLCERMLVRTGVESRLGEVEEGTATLDWMSEERERGISITAAATRLPWRDHVLHLIDTPGHVDFTIEVERSLRVLDGAVLVIDALAGVQAQSETVWRQLSQQHRPAVIFVNKLDRAGADFLAAVADAERRLGLRCVPIAYPIHRDGALVGVVDVVSQHAFAQAPAESEQAQARLGPQAVPLPPALADEVGVLRAELIDRLSVEDDALFDAIAHDASVDDALILAALRRCTLSGSIVPVACGSALRCIGVDLLLDAVIALLPSPTDGPPRLARRRNAAVATADVPLLARSDRPSVVYAFKQQEIARRDLTFVRVVRGKLRAGQELVVARSLAATRATALFRPHADHMEPIELAMAGDIVAVEGLEGPVSGDTLCDPSDVLALEGLELPEPVLSIAVEPRAAADRDALRSGLARLSREDPSLRVREDESSGQWVLSGMGELHLEIALQRLRSAGGVDVGRTPPRVAYREVPLAATRARASIDRAIVGDRAAEGEALRGSVELTVEPASDVAGVEVVFESPSDPPEGWRAAIRESIEALAWVGPRAGFPLVHLRVRIASFEPSGGPASEAGVVQAVASAWHELLSRLEVEIHEPMMAFEVRVPPEYAGGVLGDLQARGARIQEVRSEGPGTRVRGQVPLAGMFGYATAVRSLSQGRASFSMQPAGRRAVPPEQWAERGFVVV